MDITKVTVLHVGLVILIVMFLHLLFSPVINDDLKSTVAIRSDEAVYFEYALVGLPEEKIDAGKVEPEGDRRLELDIGHYYFWVKDKDGNYIRWIYVEITNKNEEVWLGSSKTNLILEHR
jgi:hypothetical protein